MSYLSLSFSSCIYQSVTVTEIALLQTRTLKNQNNQTALFQNIYPSIYIFIYPSAYSCLYPLIYRYISLFIYLPGYLPISLPFQIPTYLSIQSNSRIYQFNLFIFLSIQFKLSIHRSIQSTHLSIQSIRLSDTLD